MPDSQVPRGATILVVDDNQTNRELAQAILEDEEYTVMLASGGEEALRLFGEVAPDCVLLDVRMPGMDGFAVCSRLRELPNGPETPVLFLTALRDVDTFDRAALVGGDDFLTKPVRPTELLTRVQTALRLRKVDSERRELFAEVRRQRDALTRLQLQKEQLTAFVVHDLKNPVASMDLNAQLIVRDKAISPRSRNAALQVQTSARQLLRLILNLLDIGKSEQEKLALRRLPTDLAALAREVLGEMQVQAEASEVTLRTDADRLEVAVDPDLIRRALANLVENAIRHAPEQSEVWVRLVAGDDGVDVRIADAGTGVPEEKREAIFEQFVQLASGANSRSGRGLGLAFCKLAVEAHGGRIWVEDGSPGAVFCVRLPHERSQEGS
jgi:two-component system sensor histidine kinase/response regulator